MCSSSRPAPPCARFVRKPRWWRTSISRCCCSARAEPAKKFWRRLIHKLSPRAHRTFLKVNCAAVPADLLESELFGYEPGAFTGATHAKPGKFELCNKGTILLDEIGEMPPLLQAKLLHVLQDQQFSRLGSRSVIKVDVRILAATNINIPEALATKRLREDLYYRLNAFTLSLPPLRDRKEEIPILLKHSMTRMAERYARTPLPLSPNLLQACQNHSWPGNLRELNNFLKRYLILGDESLAVSELLPKLDGNGGVQGDSSSRGGDAGGLKSLAPYSERRSRSTKPSRKRSSRPTGIASKLRRSCRSATKHCSTRSASTASPNPRVDITSFLRERKSPAATVLLQN